MGADKLSENTPNAPKFICPNCLPKFWDFDEERLHWVSEVHVCEHHLQAICEEGSQLALLSHLLSYYIRISLIAVEAGINVEGMKKLKNQ